ncbi:MAG: class I SAM-dependent methyltransferase [Chloroflexota bacterium]
MYEANRQFWNAISDDWREFRDRDQIWTQLTEKPELAFDGKALEMIHDYVGTLQNKRVGIIGSGDNYVAFALAGLGATVTSIDISQAQLDVAASRAKTLGLSIEFIQADARYINEVANNCFDLVFSSNGFYVWIAEPGKVFAEVHRILGPNGYYIFYDVHPFQRPWINRKEDLQLLEMKKSYWDTGPFVEKSDQVTYEFNWTMADMLNPLIDSGLVLKRIAESPPVDSRFWQGHSYATGTDDRLMDWRNNPQAGLPAWLTVVAQKG